MSGLDFSKQEFRSHTTLSQGPQREEPVVARNGGPQRIILSQCLAKV